VWTAGAADWMPARSVTELFPAGTLAYAQPGLVDGTVAPAPFAPPPDDPGPFFKVGRLFTVGKQAWTGKAYVSPSSFYLLKLSRNRQGSYAAGGAIGMLLSAALTTDDMTRSCDITDLPETVRRQLDPKLKKKKGDVIILHRDALTFLKTTSWGSVTPTIGNEAFPVNTGLFGKKKVKQFLRDQGWTLDYPMEPTIAPTHGRGYGLDDEQIQKKAGKSVLLRIIYVIIAILVFAAVFASAFFKK
jgi:hypothetical protein